MTTTTCGPAAVLPASIFCSNQYFVLSRAAAPDDFDNLRAITHTARASGDILERDTNVASVEAPSDLFILRNSCGTAVACFGVETYDNCWELFSFCVNPAHRGLGIGAAMLQLALSTAIAERKTLLAMSRSAPDWFMKFGFVSASYDLLPAARRARIDLSRGSALMMYSPSQPQPRQIRLSLSDRQFWYDPQLDRSILDAADRHQVQMESLCNGGLCGTCSVPLRLGNCKSVLAHPRAPRGGYMLPCISEPLTDIILEA
jgi:N-acetylglutamate synthase-like GNAT family acetyltransferase/ferredoxin